MPAFLETAHKADKASPHRLRPTTPMVVSGFFVRASWGVQGFQVFGFRVRGLRFFVEEG